MVLAGTALDFPLTEEQRAVVNSDAHALVATASAGTGKTEILARRAERFVNDPATEGARVLVITYTTRAANEFKSRLRARVGGSMHRIVAETIHGFAHSILRTHGGHIGLPTDFQVLNTYEDRAELLARFSLSEWPDSYHELFRRLDLARATGTADPLLKTWRDALDNSGVLDFSEMITKATELLQISAIARLQRNIYGLVIVDEAQNLTKQQYQLIAALIGRDDRSGLPMVSATLLGDPNQSVTRFAGGDATLMRQFVDDYGANEFELTENFRSSKRLAALERVVSRELGRAGTDPRVRAERSSEGVVCVREFPDEACEGSSVADWAAGLLDEGMPPESVSPGERRGIQPEDIAVLARHSAALNSTSEALVAKGHAVARAHSDEDLMATSVGAVAVMLMRSRSPRHRLAASGALRRELQLHELDLSSTDTHQTRAALAAALLVRSADHLDILVPLLDAESPSEFIDGLGQCTLPDTARCEMLAGWPSDQQVIVDAWTEFAAATPVADRTWSRFVTRFAQAQSARDLGPGIRLLTVHKAQGREFQAVALVGMNDGQFPDFRATTDESAQAERQAFYVAVTRASRMLILTRARVRPTRFGDRSTEPSPFLRLAAEAGLAS